MRLRAVWILFPAVLLAACARPPEAYAPPPQRRFPLSREPDELGLLLRMNEPRALAHIVRGVAMGPPEGVGWRWAHERAELRFTLPRTQDLKAVVDLAIVPAVFEETGPVHVSVFVNERLLASRRCDRPGRYLIEQAAPADWLKAGGTTVLAAAADRYHTAADGAKLSFILYRAGFALRGEVIE